MFTEISGILILSGHSSWLETVNTDMSQGEKIKARRLSRPNIHLKTMRSFNRSSSPCQWYGMRPPSSLSILWHHLNLWAMQWWTLCILQCNHYHCHTFSSLSLINSHKITSSSRNRHSKPHQNIVESISKELQVQHTRFCRGAPQTAGE